MTPSSSCQKCRQPLSLVDSIAALSPSAYDIISASLTSERHHSSFQPDLSRLPTSLRNQYDVANSARHYSSSTSNTAATGRAVLPMVKVSNPYAPNRTSTTSMGPEESFFVLTESVVRPARTATVAEQQNQGVSQNGAGARTVEGSAGNSTEALGGPSASPLTPRLAQLSNIYSLLSSSSSIDYPVCTECMESLLGIMGKELEDGKKQRDRLMAYEKDVVKRRADPANPGREVLEKEISKLKKAEAQAIEDLKSVEAQQDLLDKEKLQLDEEEEALAEEEAEFWRAHSKGLTAAASLRDRTASLETRLAHDSRELEKLCKTNVYNDAFCIGQEKGFGTINGLRFGRLPGIPVEWPEINAAWGHVLLLLHTVARKFSLTFENYRLVPMGSFSRVERTSGDKAIYELYGSGDFAVTRILQNRRFDMAMVAFLDCLRQAMEFVKERDKTVKLPHAVQKDRIGDVSIKLQFGSDETWTRALRHVLLDLKILLGRASL